MAWYEKEERHRKIIKGLKKLGLEIKKRAKHDSALHIQSQRKTIIPRHTILKKYTVGSIYESLIESGFDEEAIKKLSNGNYTATVGASTTFTHPD